MNSLEWINKQIEECKQAIQQLKIRIDEDKNYPSFIKCHNERLEELELILQTLQQIKAELEAWEVCINDNAILDILKTLAKGESINWHRLLEEQQKIMQKALEVKDGK